jgi:adenylate cyclase
MKKKSVNIKFNPRLFAAISGSTSFVFNLIAVIFISLLYLSQVFTVDEYEMLDDMQYSELLFFLFFALPTLLTIWYLLPFIAPKTFNKKNLWKRRLLNAPLLIALIGTTGWFLSIIVSSVSFVISYQPEHILFYIKDISGNILTMIFSFMWIYYLVDLYNRHFFIKQLFNDEPLSQTKGVIHFSIKNRFIVFFISTVLLPLFILSNYSLYFMQISNDFSNSPQLLIVILDILIIVGLVTYLFMRTYRNPIIELAEATEKIRRGKYDVNVQIRSTDELGRLAEAVNETAASLNEKEIIKDTFGKMVDPHVRDYLLSGNLKLGGENRESTILFSDIRGFTSISEKMTPELTVDFLNTYFEEMNECIEKNNGLINKYIGDAVLGIFGTPVPLENHAYSAIHAAISMRERLTFLNKDLEKKHMPKIDFGVGIHSGEVVAGNIGSRNRMEFTVIGDNVNIAARLESLTKTYGVPVIITGETKKLLNDESVNLREIDYVRVKGRLKPIKIYEVFEADTQKRKKQKFDILETFHDALRAYREKKFAHAMKLFEECSKYMPYDKVSKIYIKRCNTLKLNPPSEKWNGIATISS